MNATDSIYAKLLTTAAVGIVIVDQDGRIVLVNYKTEELFDYRSEELIGRRVEILLPEWLQEPHTRHRHNYMAAPYDRPIGTGDDLSARRKGGEHFPVEVSLSHAETANGKLVMAVISDISERKKLEKAQAWLFKQRISELETTLHALEKVAGHPVTPPGSNSPDSKPLRKSMPAAFLDLAAEYSRIMTEAIARNTELMGEDLATAMDHLGANLVYLQATARDVVDLHSQVLLEQAKIIAQGQMQSHLDEAHFLLVELLGRLATHYRARALGDDRP